MQRHRPLLISALALLIAPFALFSIGLTLTSATGSSLPLPRWG
jgi:hypothetical protein